jgi:hypothetical protein
MTRSGNIGSHGNFGFSFLRNIYTVFHSGCTNLHSTQQFIKVPFPHILANICYCVLENSHFNSSKVKSQCHFDFICISFIARDNEPFSVYLLAIYTPFQNHLFCLFINFLIELLILWELSFLSSLYILVINPLVNV